MTTSNEKLNGIIFICHQIFYQIDVVSDFEDEKLLSYFFMLKPRSNFLGEPKNKDHVFMFHVFQYRRGGESEVFPVPKSI